MDDGAFFTVFFAPALLAVTIIVVAGAIMLTILSLLALMSGLAEAVARSAQRRGTRSEVIEMSIDEVFPGSVPIPRSFVGDPAVTRAQDPGALNRHQPSQNSHAALQFFAGGAVLFFIALIRLSHLTHPERHRRSAG